MSVAVAVGLIALAGVEMLIYLDQAREEAKTACRAEGGRDDFLPCTDFCADPDD